MLLALAALPAYACAQPAGPSPVHLSIEQPVYAGMPVWLDVQTDDPCIAAHYDGDLRGFTPAGHAEIIDNAGKPVQRDLPLLISGLRGEPVQAGICPSPDPNDDGHSSTDPLLQPHRHQFNGMPPGLPATLPARGTPGPNRIPLHLAADLRAPGHYSVRWLAPTTDKLGKIAPTPWLGFEILPATAAQREAWLTSLLAHAPSERAKIEQAYVPALLADWTDPRVMRKIVDYVCADDAQLAVAVMQAISDDAQPYLADSIQRGCLSAGLRRYVSTVVIPAGGSIHRFPEEFRRRFLPAVASQLQQASGAKLANALSILADLRGRRHDGYGASTDQAVLQTLPHILAQPPAKSGHLTEDPKWELVDYSETMNDPSNRRAILRALATQPDPAAPYALSRLMEDGTLQDIPFLRGQLLNATDVAQLTGQISPLNALPKTYGVEGISLLRSVMQGAQSPDMRAYAAMVLADAGDGAGIDAIVSGLQGPDSPAKRALELQLMKGPACSDGCGLQTGGSPEQMARNNAPTESKLLSYYEGKRTPPN